MSPGTAKSALQQAFAAQAKSCKRLGSPFTSLVCQLFATRKLPRGPVSAKLEQWPGDPGGARDALPLRVAGALHGLVLEGKCPQLAALYPTNNPEAPYAMPEADALWAAISDALIEHKLFMLARLESAPQTNEVRRCGALIGALLTLTDRFKLPIMLSEIGASAGLNLHPDKYRYQLGKQTFGDEASTVLLRSDWTGDIPPAVALTVAGRAGCDLNPLNPADRTDQQRLLSYIWPDQHDRMARTRAAMRIAGASNVRVEPADAAVWLAKRLESPRPRTLHVVLHTIALQYFDEESAARCEQEIALAGQRADATAPIAWLRMESDAESSAQDGAALTLTIWPGGQTHAVGRAGYHGQWVRWHSWEDNAKPRATGKKKSAARVTSKAKVKAKAKTKAPAKTKSAAR